MTVKQHAAREAHACYVKMRPLTVRCFPFELCQPGNAQLSKDPSSLLSIFCEVEQKD